jgi:hypothetical protein
MPSYGSLVLSDLTAHYLASSADRADAKVPQHRSPHQLRIPCHALARRGHPCNGFPGMPSATTLRTC